LYVLISFAFAFNPPDIHSNGVKKINYGVVKKYFRVAAELKYFRRSSLFLAISVQSVIFATFHPGKVGI
jgi:hypothetical protein